MKDIAFVLWVSLWPLVCTIDYYFSVKTKLLAKEEIPSKGAKAFTALIQIAIWIFVANLF